MIRKYLEDLTLSEGRLPQRSYYIPENSKPTLTVYGVFAIVPTATRTAANGTRSRCLPAGRQ